MNKKILISNENNIKDFKTFISYIPLPSKKNGFLTQNIKKKNLFITIFYSIGVLFYLLSLCHINSLDLECYFATSVHCYYILAILTLISSIITSLSIYIIIYYNYNKFHLIIIFIIYSFLLLIDHDNGIIKHGLFNFLGFIVANIFIFSLLLFSRFLFFLLKKKKFFLLLLIIISFSYFFIYLKKYKLNNFNCDNWSKGLNNTSIDNDSKNYPCKIKIPKPHSCYLKEIGQYFDLTKKYRPTCLDPDILKKEKNNFLEDIKNLKYSNISKKNHFGFPLTNIDDINPYDYGNICYKVTKSFGDYVYDNIIYMDLYHENKTKYYPNIPRPEIEVKFEGDYGKFIINVHKNETLIKEREEIINKKERKSMYKNVLVMFFDTLSRSHFFRKFPKTINFFNQFVKYETNPERKNMTIFQYFKYHTLNTYTDPNLIAAYYGAKLFGNGTHFGKYFKENGYIIGRINGYCEKEAVVNLKNLKAFTHTRFDHEGMSLGCISAFYKGMLVTMGSSLIKKCLFGKDINQYALEYLESFWNSYIEQNKMFVINIIDGHEPTGELIGHFDEILYEFLNKFYIKGWFKDTSIIIFSDHGMHINGPLYLFDSQDFFYERTLALLFLIIPNDEKLYKNDLYEKMKSNQQTFVTPFDIYNTLIHLASGDLNEKYMKNSVSYGNSLFTEINYKKRYCQSLIYESMVNLKYCNCEIK